MGRAACGVPPVASCNNASPASSGRWAGEVQHTVFICSTNVVEPLYRHAVAQQLIVRYQSERRRLRRRLLGDFDVPGDCDLLDGLTYLHELRGASARMCLQFTALRPLVLVLVVVDVAHRHIVARLVNDDADVLIYASRAEVAVSGPLDPVHPQPGTCRIGLQIEHGRLD